MMAGERGPVVAVSPPAAFAAHRRLFESLAAACGVTFAPSGAVGRPHARIVVGDGDVPSVSELGGPGVPTLALASSGRGELEDVTFDDGEHVERALRRMELTRQLTAAWLETDATEEVLARTGAGPAWTRVRGTSFHRLRAALPEVGVEEVLRTLLGPDDRRRTFALLAIVAFLREIAPDRWPAPPLRATFLFDDPNLRRPRYGHIDYRALADHAARHSYHAGMAMVPIDARRPHPDAVTIFERRSDRLSLVIHGNDHIHLELLRARDRQTACGLAAQALRRIERFEAASGLQVGRVMVPPHGMCSRSVAGALAGLGYDALCAIHPAPWTERPPTDLTLAGWTPATFVDGCAVIPRLPLGCRPSDIALRAFLGQPLVLYGHHGDVAGGYDLLAQQADLVNRLGPVRWCSLREIVRTNYQIRVEHETAHIRPWANRLDVTVPAGAHWITVLPPTGSESRWHGIDSWGSEDAAGGRLDLVERLPTGGRDFVSLALGPRAVLDASRVPDPRHRPPRWARRRVAEMRDRLAPVTYRATARGGRR